jgi:phage/plasmid-associated DNA primase
MAKKPKKSEYKASEAEKTEAKIAQKEYLDYKRKYSPLLEAAKIDSERDYSSLLKGRANADIAQTTAFPSLRAAENSYLGAATASNAAKAMLEAGITATNIKDTNKTNVLAAARKQATTTQQGLSQAARIGTSNILADSRNKMLVRGATAQALGDIGTSTMIYGKEKGWWG